MILLASVHLLTTTRMKSVKQGCCDDLMQGLTELVQDLFILHLKFFERGFLDGSYAICSRIFTLLNMDSTRFGRSLQCSLFTSSKTSHHESDLSSDSPRE